MRLAFIAAIIVASLAAFFAVQNVQVVKVSFLGWYFEASLVMVLMITFASGALATMLTMLPASLKKSLEIKHLKAHILTVDHPEVPVDSADSASRKPQP